MSFRFRLGPFTFGRTGTRLSLWGDGGGVSIPLSGEGRSFGKVGFGPFSWFFGGSSAALGGKSEVEAGQRMLGPYDGPAIKAFRSDHQFHEKLRRHGVPWRGVQERLKEELPDLLADRDKIAYRLVPQAMDAVFGPQETSWKTVRRKSKRGSGFTTWIVLIEAAV